MTTRLRSRAVLAAGLILLALGVQVQPASAHATVQVTSPRADQQLDAPKANVNGQVEGDSHTLGGTTTTVERVTMKLSTAGQPDVPASATPSGGSVSFPVELLRNGAYEVTLTAAWKHTGLDNSTTGTATTSRTFLVAVPPTPPTNVKTAVDAASRAVAVTWKANAEPDLIRYEVKRAKGNSTDFTTLAKPRAGETTYLDSTTSAAGGDYRYLVVAVRKGVPGNEEITSDPSALSADAVAKVPDPPPPPTTAAPAAAAGGRGTASSIPAGSPGALTTPGTVDLSGFNTVRNQTRSVTPRTLPLPDPGFQSTLPFAPGETISDEPLVDESGDLGELAADSPQYRELGDETSSDDRARTMAFFAAGLLATVLLMHVLWVKSEVKRVPLEAVDPDPRPGDGWSAAAAGKGRRGRRNAGPGPTLDDISAADFAPVVVAPGTRGAKSPARSGARTGGRRQKVSTGL
ncbi:MAG: hypothetical protein ACR2MO_06875 [Acidimicrobiales bacterium]